MATPKGHTHLLPDLRSSGSTSAATAAEQGTKTQHPTRQGRRSTTTTSRQQQGRKRTWPPERGTRTHFLTLGAAAEQAPAAATGDAHTHTHTEAGAKKQRHTTTTTTGSSNGRRRTWPPLTGHTHLLPDLRSSGSTSAATAAEQGTKTQHPTRQGRRSTTTTSRQQQRQEADVAPRTGHTHSLPDLRSSSRARTNNRIKAHTHTETQTHTNKRQGHNNTTKTSRRTRTWPPRTWHTHPLPDRRSSSSTRQHQAGREIGTHPDGPACPQARSVGTG